MFKKILVILGLVLVCAVFSGYFYLTGSYAASQSEGQRCDNIDVIITNPQEQNFISESEVADMVRKSVIGKQTDEINAFALEQRLCASSAICKAEAYVSGPTTLTLEVTQRHPVVRFMTPGGGFYCDSSGYILPLLGKVTLDLPIVSGRMLFDVPASRSGYPARGREWLTDMLRLTETIRTNAYWSREIEQIWVEDNTDVVLYTRSGNEKFILGSPRDAAAKLEKMAGYYRTIKPAAKKEGKNYTTVNLKYKDQIICK